MVEALASTFYRALRDSLETSIPRAALAALARDEARHYGMFLAMLHEEQKGLEALGRWRRCWIGLRRMTELGDQQIIGAYAAACTAQVDSEPSWLPSQQYAAALYPRYRLRHLLFAARLLCPVLFERRDGLTVMLFALLLHAGVRLRGTVSCGKVCGVLLWKSATTQ